jgi:hypothetical protein
MGYTPKNNYNLKFKSKVGFYGDAYYPFDQIALPEYRQKKKYMNEKHR